MSCHVQQIEFAGRKVDVICCTDEPDTEPQACAFCTSPGELLCDWPMAAKCVKVRAEEASVGDLWITEKNRKRAGIVAIEDLDAYGRRTDGEPESQDEKPFLPRVPIGPCVRRRIWIAIPGHPNPYPYVRGIGETFETERPGTCDAPMCTLHAREVGDDRHYCQSHWRSWEEV